MRPDQPWIPQYVRCEARETTEYVGVWHGDGPAVLEASEVGRRPIGGMDQIVAASSAVTA